MLDELIGRTQIIALFIILLGVVLVSLPKKKTENKPVKRGRELIREGD